MATLTSDSLLGCNSIPSFIESGTKMTFNDTNAPTSWTKDTSSHNNKTLRVVNGTISSGGSIPFTDVFQSSKGTFVGIDNQVNTTYSTLTHPSIDITTDGVDENPLLAVQPATLSSNQNATHRHVVSRGGTASQLDLSTPGPINRMTFIGETRTTGNPSQPSAPESHIHQYSSPLTTRNHSHTVTYGAHSHEVLGPHSHQDGFPDRVQFPSPTQIIPSQYTPPTNISPQNFNIMYVDVILATKD